LIILTLLVAAFTVLVARFRSLPRQVRSPEDKAAQYLHWLAGDCGLPEHRAHRDFLEGLFPGLATAPGVRAEDGWLWSETPDWAMFCDPNAMDKQVVVYAIIFVTLMIVLVVLWCCC
jgi:hypothetical protein